MARIAGLCAVSAAMVVALAPAASGAPAAGIEVLASDLSSPKGLGVTNDRDLLVGQGAFGPPGPAVEYDLRGRNAGEIRPVSSALNLIDVAVSPKDGTVWAIQAGELGGSLVRISPAGAELVLDIPAYQAADPDPDNTEGDPAESNAYGLTVDRKGNVLVADAANNDLIRVAPDGSAVTAARFGVELVSTDHLGDPTLPPFLPTEAVPTSVTIGQDGAIYVGELKGFPFRPGSSNVWRINADAVGAECSVNAAQNCSLYAGGFTSIQDIAFGSGSKLYVYELAEGGALAFEAGFETGDFPPAVLLAVDKARNGSRTEIAAGQLSQPGGLAVVNNVVYATDNTFTGGRLVKVN